MTVRADADRCIGSGMCVLTAPGVFDQDEEGTVLVIDADPIGTQAEPAADAVANCPAAALSVTQDK